MRSLLRRLLVSPERNLDLVVMWVLLATSTTLIPVDFVLARGDLVPWITLCVSVAALLRARSLGDPPHPSLTPRRVRWSALAGTAGRIVVPVAAMAWFDAARLQETTSFVLAVLASLVAGTGIALGHFDGQVAWRPPSGKSWWRWVLRALLLVAASGMLGWLERFVPTGVPHMLPGAALLGVQLTAVGVMQDHFAVRWQREAAGRRDGKPYHASLYRKVLALIGPSAGLGLLYVAVAPISLLGFEQAAVVALHILAWTAVLWPPSIPVGVSCVLHEVVPAAGKDPAAKAEAPAFERPPKGALRLDPMGIRRLRVLHHWVVPVLDPRIEDLDDPVRPLWASTPLPTPAHILGVAAFEPEHATQVPQWHTITIRLDAQEDMNVLTRSSVQTRRMVVLRPFASRGTRTGRYLRTYRWDPEVEPGSLQVVDATTTRLFLQDGDIIVLSTEGVARAFELELGRPIYHWSEVGHVRPPQLEDYVGAR